MMAGRTSVCGSRTRPSRVLLRDALCGNCFREIISRSRSGFALYHLHRAFSHRLGWHKMEFKIPSTIPQDLQLIQDIIGEIPVSTPPLRSSKSTSPVPLRPIADDSIDSSDESDTDSEREVEANILEGIEDEDEELPSR